mmetsp:Transcript_32567/g.107694  ORF Transcript_32567/g.107694 Transcript_32567/m.107694 type:complete len:592 (-) Transcript_32567:240-2015(-)
MLFGVKLRSGSHPPWVSKYVPYELLKQTISQLEPNCEENAAIEGIFLTQLLSAVHQVNNFYLSKEQELSTRLEALTALLHSPRQWVLSHIEAHDSVSLPSLVPLFEAGVHAAKDKVDALGEFVRLCEDIDHLRKYSVLNYLAAAKIVKKHDKHSSISLRESVMKFVGSLPFYQSRLLASSFTHAQCIASEIVASAVGSAALDLSAEYTCGICMDVLNMPVVLSCAHRFCYGCLSRACLYDHHCPLCKKDTDLDPSNYHIDPILTKFVDAHCARDHGGDEGGGSLAGGASSSASDEAEGVTDARKGQPLFGKPLLKRCSAPTIPAGSDKGAAPPRPPSESDEDSATAPAEAEFDRPTGQILRSLKAGGAAPPGKDALVPAKLSPLDAAALGVGVSVQLPPVVRNDPADLSPRSKKLGIAAASASGPRSAMKKKACVECHRAKAACEGDPCVRCIRLGKTCVTLARLPRRRRIKSGEDRAAGGGKAAALAPPAEVVAPFASPSAARPAPMPEAGTRRTKAPKLSDAPFGQVLDADFVDARLLSDPPEAPAFANPVPSQVPAFATSAGPGAGISDDCMFLSTDELTSLITAVDF